MQRCDLAPECAVCNVPFCPYSSEDYGQNDTEDEAEWEDGDEGW